MAIRDNTLSARWTKRRSEGVNFDRVGDLMYEWGDGCRKADGALLHNALTGQQMHVDYSGPTKGIRFDPSFVEDLIARGYDITTLRFSIKKLPPAPTPNLGENSSTLGLSTPPTEQDDGN